jgi:hypothetical protein
VRACNAVSAHLAGYTSTGQLDIIAPLMRRDVLSWRRAFRKPIMVSEFGADAVAGVHSHPSVAFSEEFQSDYLTAHYATFDEMRRAGIFIGEHVWNFADFMTSQVCCVRMSCGARRRALCGDVACVHSCATMASLPPCHVTSRTPPLARLACLLVPSPRRLSRA